MEHEKMLTGGQTENRLPMEARKRRAALQSRLNREAVERLVHGLFFLCGFAAVACVLFISIYLVISGLPAILEIGPAAFLTGEVWAPKQELYGILPFVLTSLAGTGGAILIGVPIGVLTAMFLAKVANENVAAVIRTAVSLLAGIPSVVYGLVGMVVLVPGVQKLFGLSSGANLLSAIVVLAIMILPSIINVAETSLRAVPKEYEEASLALGATHIETIFRVSLPAARSGVATAIASEMNYAPVGSLWKQSLFSIGLVLFLFIILINVFLNVFIKRKKEG